MTYEAQEHDSIDAQPSTSYHLHTLYLYCPYAKHTATHSPHILSINTISIHAFIQRYPAVTKSAPESKNLDTIFQANARR